MTARKSLIQKSSGNIMLKIKRLISIIIFELLMLGSFILSIDRAAADSRHVWGIQIHWDDGDFLAEGFYGDQTFAITPEVFSHGKYFGTLKFSGNGGRSCSSTTDRDDSVKFCASVRSMGGRAYSVSAEETYIHHVKERPIPVGASLSTTYKANFTISFEGKTCELSVTSVGSGRTWQHSSPKEATTAAINGKLCTTE
jgi:hypothetical protein